MLPHKYNDGGRSAYFKGSAGDCVTRSLAIYLGLDYKQVYQELQERQAAWIDSLRRKNTKKAKAILKRSNHSIREGCYNEVWMPYLKEHGLVKTRTGYGGQTRMPARTVWNKYGDGIYVVNSHLFAVLNGYTQDTHDPLRYILVTDEGYRELRYRKVIWHWGYPN